MTASAASLGITYLLTVRVPQLIGIGANAARREHHMARARRVKRERVDVALVLSQFSTPPIHPGSRVVVTLTRCAPGKIDSDGAVHAMKGVRDEVAKWMRLDDGDDRIEWVVERKKVPRKEQGTVIRVEARTA